MYLQNNQKQICNIIRIYNKPISNPFAVYECECETITKNVKIKQATTKLGKYGSKKKVNIQKIGENSQKNVSCPNIALPVRLGPVNKTPAYTKTPPLISLDLCSGIYSISAPIATQCPSHKLWIHSWVKPYLSKHKTLNPMHRQHIQSNATNAHCHLTIYT